MGSEQAILVADETRVHPITVEEFLALDEAGFFKDVGRVELIDGRIYEMAAVHRPHSETMATLTTDINVAIRASKLGLKVLSPVSARLDPNSLPEADIMVALSGDESIVPGAEVRLMVEVADTSLGHDLGVKARLYARTGVTEYWVADVRGRRIIRFHEPDGASYVQRAEFAFGEPITSATIAGLVVDTTYLV